jgi:hypothetical protein
VFIDQPIGTGFSYGNVRRNTEEQLAEDAYWAMQNLFKYYPQYAQLPLYITGESYVRNSFTFLYPIFPPMSLTKSGLPFFFF